MAQIRIWHSSRDAYHCAFRLCRLLLAPASKTIELERARILDMFLLYPSLLYRASMPFDVKAKFRELKLSRPDESFVRLPGAATVFQDLRLYQNSAVAQLAAKGILDATALQKGLLQLNPSAAPQDFLNAAYRRNDEDHGLSNFLVGPFSEIPLRGSQSVYRKVGLPARAIAA